MCKVRTSLNTALMSLFLLRNQDLVKTFKFKTLNILCLPNVQQVRKNLSLNQINQRTVSSAQISDNQLNQVLVAKTVFCDGKYLS